MIKYGFVIFLKDYLYKKLNINFNYSIKDRLGVVKGSAKTDTKSTFIEIYELKEYDFKINPPKIIIDLGANIGISSRYFKSIFPKSKILAIEPDENNFEYLKENTKNLKNIILLNQPAWCNSKPITIVTEKFSTGTTTKEDTLGKTKGITINQIIKKFDLTHIDLIKIDIEGAEHQLLRKNNSWFKKTNNIFIEIHGTTIEREELKNYLGRRFIQKGQHSNVYWFSKIKQN